MSFRVLTPDTEGHIADILERLRRIEGGVATLPTPPISPEHTHVFPDADHEHYLYPPFTFPGVASVQTGGPRWYAPFACTIVGVRASVNVAPTGASLIVDVNKNGTTIFTTQANRPTIAASGFTDMADAINVPGLSLGDYLQCDVDQIGSTIPGTDVTVQVLMTID